MKIAFVCPWDAADPNAMSGYAYSMRQAFLAEGHDIVDVFPVADPLPRYTPSRVAAKLLGQFYNGDRRTDRLRAMAGKARAAIKATSGVDLVFAPSSLPVSALDIAAPIVFSTDQTFANLLEGYISHPTAAYRSEGMAQERSALQRAAAAIYPSQWARDSAISAFGAHPETLHVIPWGANLPTVPGRDNVLRALAARADADTLQLCFVAREWERKGGPQVFETLRILSALGVRVKLNVVGVTPIVPDGLPVEIISNLDKAAPADFAQWQQIMAGAHLLFVPSRAEAYGQVFCEAAAYAIPSVTRAVGGIPSIVLDGQTGLSLAPDADAEQFAHRIARIWSDRPALLEMGRQARMRFEDTLNWPSFARAATRVFEDVLQSGPAQRSSA